MNFTVHFLHTIHTHTHAQPFFGETYVCDYVRNVFSCMPYLLKRTRSIFFFNVMHENLHLLFADKKWSIALTRSKKGEHGCCCCSSFVFFDQKKVCFASATYSFVYSKFLMSLLRIQMHRLWFWNASPASETVHEIGELMLNHSVSRRLMYRWYH